MSVTLVIGLEIEAVFKCQHQSLEAIIGWRVNGLPDRRFSDIVPGFITENATLVPTLTIPAKSKYNGTEVECVAVYTDGSPTEVTPPALLTIIEGLI